MTRRRYRKHARIFLSRYRRYLTCPACGGGRLKPAALLFRLGGKTVPDVERMPITEAESFFRLQSAPGGDRATELLLDEIRGRLRFLLDVGLGYLSLGRSRGRSPGGRPSGSLWPRPWGLLSPARFMSSTSPPSASIRATRSGWPGYCASSPPPEMPWSSWSTTRSSSGRRTGSLTWAPVPDATGAE